MKRNQIFEDIVAQWVTLGGIRLQLSKLAASVAHAETFNPEQFETLRGLAEIEELIAKAEAAVTKAKELSHDVPVLVGES